MKKVLLIMLALVCALGLTACHKKDEPLKPDHSSTPGASAPSESSAVSPPPGTTGSPNEGTTFTGRANGYGGLVTVVVTVDNDSKITDVVVTAPDETEAIAGTAIKEIPEAIKRVGTTTDVDTIAGATVTSRAIIDAVNNAIDPQAHPYEESTPLPPSGSSAPVNPTPSSVT